MNKGSQSLGRTLLSAPVLRRRVKELAASITAHYRGQPLTVLALLNGSVFFLVDLARFLPVETEIECWRVRSYEGTESGGQVHGLAHCEGNFAGRHVLIVDDILDTGLTLDAVRRRVLELGAARAEICVLLRKKRKRVVKVAAKWTGFDIPNAFVIGYGLDLDGKYRALKSIRVLEPASAGSAG